jgi:hypothetical protein
MVVDQAQEEGAYGRAYDPSRLLELARDYWKAGFEGMTFDRFRGLLDEMIGLGVLTRGTHGQFRLRSPNLVRLMGSERDILTRLAELGSRVFTEGFDADSHRAMLDDKGQHYSPFTYEQARTLAHGRPGVAVVFGSRALGLQEVGPALRQMFEPEHPIELPGDVRSVEAVRGLVERAMRERRKASRIVFVQHVSPQEGRLDVLVTALLETSTQLSRGKDRPVVRFVLVLNPEATWHWLGLPESVLRDLEAQADAPIALVPWKPTGLERRLEHQGKISSQQKIRALLEATGGWPILVDRALIECGRSDDPNTGIARLMETLASPGTFREDFLSALGLESASGAIQVLRFVQTERHGIALDDVDPDYIEGPVPLNPPTCRRLVAFLLRFGALVERSGLLSVDPIVSRTLNVP